MNVGQACCWCNIFSYCDRAQCWCLCGHIEDLSRTDTVQSTSGSVRKHVHEMPGDKLNWHGWLKWAWLGKKSAFLSAPTCSWPEDTKEAHSESTLRGGAIACKWGEMVQLQFKCRLKIKMMNLSPSLRSAVGKRWTSDRCVLGEVQGPWNGVEN